MHGCTPNSPTTKAASPQPRLRKRHPLRLLLHPRRLARGLRGLDVLLEHRLHVTCDTSGRGEKGSGRGWVGREAGSGNGNSCARWHARAGQGMEGVGMLRLMLAHPAQLQPHACGASARSPRAPTRLLDAYEDVVVCFEQPRLVKVGREGHGAIVLPAGRWGGSGRQGDALGTAAPVEPPGHCRGRCAAVGCAAHPAAPLRPIPGCPPVHLPARPATSRQDAGKQHAHPAQPSPSTNQHAAQPGRTSWKMPPTVMRSQVAAAP